MNPYWFILISGLVLAVGWQKLGWFPKLLLIVITLITTYVWTDRTTPTYQPIRPALEQPEQRYP